LEEYRCRRALWKFVVVRVGTEVAEIAVEWEVIDQNKGVGDVREKLSVTVNIVGAFRVDLVGAAGNDHE
jgi:hypothetical protein